MKAAIPLALVTLASLAFATYQFNRSKQLEALITLSQDQTHRALKICDEEKELFSHALTTLQQDVRACKP